MPVWLCLCGVVCVCCMYAGGGRAGSKSGGGSVLMLCAHCYFVQVVLVALS